jgi:hypothetical protein
VHAGLERQIEVGPAGASRSAESEDPGVLLARAAVEPPPTRAGPDHDGPTIGFGDE